VVEWPPSPYRLLRGLVASWHERAWTLDAETVTRLVQRLIAVPPTYCLPPYQFAHTRHYYPGTDHRYGNHSTDKVLDAFVVTERDAELRVSWPVAVDGPEREALAELVRSLPHIGRADSICVGRIVDDSVTEPSARPLLADEYPPSGHSTTMLLAPDVTAHLSDLTARPGEVRRNRLARPPATRWVRYSLPPEMERRRPVPSVQRVAPTAARWVIAGTARPSAYATLAVTHVLRRACQSAYGKLFEHATSAQLSGKDEDGNPLSGHVHAHYLALDRRQSHAARGDRRIEDLLVWVDEATGGFEDRVTAALGLIQLEGLRNHGYISDFRPLRLGFEALGPVGDVAPELTGPATSWETHTPFLPTRHPKRRQDLAEFVRREVERELGLRGFPKPAEVSFVTGDWSAYRRHRPGKERLRDVSRRPWGVRVEFAEAVSGPMCLGAMSHFGMGLFVPIE
jgi:CRISPR-associated protein Csb2